MPKVLSPASVRIPINLRIYLPYLRETVEIPIIVVGDIKVTALAANITPKQTVNYSQAIAAIQSGRIQHSQRDAIESVISHDELRDLTDSIISGHVTIVGAPSTGRKPVCRGQMHFTDDTMIQM